MSTQTPIEAQGYRLRRAEADAKGARRWKRRALKAEAALAKAKLIPIPVEDRAFVVEIMERDLRDRGFPEDSIAQMRDQVTRNGRWGTCAECPDATGAIYPARHRTEVFPERCLHTDRYDHWLGTDILAVYAYAKNLYEFAEHLKAHRDLVSSQLAKAEAERDEAEARAKHMLTVIQERDTERVRAEKYLAAMVEWVDAGDAAFEAVRRVLIRPKDQPPSDVMRGVENRATRAENVIRALVKQAKRG